jgi:hypothetical protein
MAKANPGLTRPHAFRWHGDNHVSVRVARNADLTALYGVVPSLHSLCISAAACV